MCGMLHEDFDRVVACTQNDSWGFDVRELRVSIAPHKVICEARLTNSANYRKYGVISFTKAEDSKKPLDKLEPKTKKQKVSLF